MFVDISRSRGRRSRTKIGTGGGETGLKLNSALVVSAAVGAVGDWMCRSLSANAEPTLRCHGSLPDDHGSTLEAGGDQGGAEIKFSAAILRPVVMIEH